MALIKERSLNIVDGAEVVAHLMNVHKQVPRMRKSSTSSNSAVC